MKEERLQRIEKAIIVLADYLEDINHADYKVKQQVLDILELEELKKPKFI